MVQVLEIAEKILSEGTDFPAMIPQVMELNQHSSDQNMQIDNCGNLVE